MKSTSKSAWNPQRLDARAFAQAGASLTATEELPQFERLYADVTSDDAEPHSSVTWQARGEMRPADSGGAPSVWLHLEATTVVPLTCQRCLGPVHTPLAVDRWYRFVADEATAAAEDDECEEDLLPLEPRPNLHDVLEDELLMELPLVPMHENCPQPVKLQSEDFSAESDEAPAARKNPFADLARLKK